MSNNFQLMNTISKLQNDKEVGKLLESSLGSKQSLGMANMIQAVKNSEKLQNCTPISIASAIITPTMLNLDISRGQGYIIPYGTNAQYILGYKGLVGLSIQTGAFENINAGIVRNGEFKGYNRLTGEPTFDFEEVEDISKIVIGYFAHYKTVNGFKKTLYWSSEQMHEHFIKHSLNNYDEKTRQWMESKKYKTVSKILTVDDKAKITMLKQLLEKWPALSDNENLSSALKASEMSFNEKGQKVIKDNKTNEEIVVAWSKENVVSLLQQCGNVLKTKETIKTKQEANSIVNKIAKESGIDFKISGGWYGISKLNAINFAKLFEEKYKCEILVDGKKVSKMEVNDVAPKKIDFDNAKSEVEKNA